MSGTGQPEQWIGKRDAGSSMMMESNGARPKQGDRGRSGHDAIARDAGEVEEDQVPDGSGARQRESQEERASGMAGRETLPWLRMARLPWWDLLSQVPITIAIGLD